MTSPMIVIPRPIGRQAEDPRPVLGRESELRFGSYGFACFLRGQHAPRRATPSLPCPVECHIGPNLSKTGNARDDSTPGKPRGFMPRSDDGKPFPLP